MSNPDSSPGPLACRHVAPRLLMAAARAVQEERYDEARSLLVPILARAGLREILAAAGLEEGRPPARMAAAAGAASGPAGWTTSEGAPGEAAAGAPGEAAGEATRGSSPAGWTPPPPSAAPSRPEHLPPLPFALSSRSSVRDACLLLLEALYMGGAFEACLRLSGAAGRAGALPADEPHAVLLRGWILHRRGRPAAALDLAAGTLRRRRRQLGQAEQAAFLHLRGMCHHSLGRKDLARRDLRSSVALYRLAGQWAGEAEALNTLGMIEAATGRLPDAESLFREAIRQTVRTGGRFRRARSLHALGIVLYKSGRPAAALPLLEEAEAIESERAREQDLLAVRLALARALLMLARQTAARRLVLPALQAATRERLPREEVLALETAGELALAEGRGAAARRYLERGLELARRPGMRADLAAGLLRRLGGMTLDGGDPAGSVLPLRRAVRAADDSGDRFEAATARRLLGTAYARLGQWGRAAAVLHRAAAVARGFGAELELARSLLEAARARLEWWRAERAGGLGGAGLAADAAADVAAGATARETDRRRPVDTRPPGGRPADGQRAEGRQADGQSAGARPADGRPPSERLLEAGPLLGRDGGADRLHCRAAHLEAAWSHVIEAFHGFASLGRQGEARACTELMDRLRAEAPPPWLRGTGSGGSRGGSARREGAGARPSGGGAADSSVEATAWSGTAPPTNHGSAGAAGSPASPRTAPRDPASRLRRGLAAVPLVARSAGMRQALQMAAVAACSAEPVLITGETGTGKELIARLVHAAGDRAAGPFVPVNCAAVPETLFEREFFGHRRGAFTGADLDKPGFCELADGGTLMLDEVGELPPGLQAKLLRLLQEGAFHRLGDPAERRVDLRIVAATNADLAGLIAERRFRRDLYYRLRILEIELPPLRERAEDIEPLVATFTARAAGPGVRPEDLIEPEVLQTLRRYPWPGNVRELESITRRLALLAGHAGRATLRMLPPEIARWRDRPAAGSGSLDLARHLQKAERERIGQALTFCDGNRTEAARLLGISRNTLYKKMERLGIRIPA